MLVRAGELPDDVHDGPPIDADETGGIRRRTAVETGSDVRHDEYGHGWVQGTGHGVVTVRFETRVTGPGVARTFSLPEPGLHSADPLDSLAWD